MITKLREVKENICIDTYYKVIQEMIKVKYFMKQGAEGEYEQIELEDWMDRMREELKGLYITPQRLLWIIYTMGEGEIVKHDSKYYLRLLKTDIERIMKKEIEIKRVE